MKVVLFCGGFGTRIQGESDKIPKPLIKIGYRPILLHLMKYYAHYGHTDFILCLGYKADLFKQYFLNYNEAIPNDFVLTERCRKVKLLEHDLKDWRITFVDTGLYSNIGQRLKAVEKYLEGEDAFMANYSDGLTDIPLPELIGNFHKQNKIAGFMSVRPSQSFHVVSMCEDSLVTDISPVNSSGLRMNGGFFIFKKEIFQYIEEGEELVLEPFQRLIKKRELFAYKYDGFWACMDTFKEKQYLEDLYSRGDSPWAVWKKSA